MNRMLKCCYGISSKADEYGHVFMSDYDGYTLESVINHLRPMQKEYGLSDLYIIESTNGFNVISFDILSLSLIYNIGVDIYSIADRNFFKYGFERGYYTLRFDQDKKLVKILKNDSTKFEKSLVHKEFIEWFFDIEIEQDQQFNDNNKLVIIQYPSSKNGYHLQEKNIPSYLERGIVDNKPF